MFIVAQNFIWQVAFQGLEETQILKKYPIKKKYTLRKLLNEMSWIHEAACCINCCCINWCIIITNTWSMISWCINYICCLVPKEFLHRFSSFWGGYILHPSSSQVINRILFDGLFCCVIYSVQSKTFIRTLIYSLEDSCSLEVTTIFWWPSTYHRWSLFCPSFGLAEYTDYCSTFW